LKPLVQLKFWQDLYGQGPSAPKKTNRLLKLLSAKFQKNNNNNNKIKLKITRRAKQEVGISGTSIQRMLHELKLKPYNPHLRHAMTEHDPDRRVEFYEIFRQNVQRMPLFLKKKLFGVTKPLLR